MNKKFVDVFGRATSWWVRPPLVCETESVVANASEESAEQSAVVELLTVAEQRQLNYWPHLGNPGYVRRHIMEPRMPTVALQGRDRACLVHSRPALVVSQMKGDAHFQLGSHHHPFLDVRGRPLTRDAEALARLAEVTSARGYTLPFWVTRTHIVDSMASCHLWSRALFGHEVNLPRLQHIFDDAARCVKLPDADGGDGVINMAEACHTFLQNPASSVDQRVRELVVVQYCRAFTPINVLTRQPFCASIEEQLRQECASCQRWCSVWGTADDHDATGNPPLVGALGVSVLDELGNDLFLIPAFGTKDPVAAYSHAYPDHFISFRP